MVASPAQYGASGIMTFIVPHDGVVSQKEFGPHTTALAPSLTTFNPDETWKTRSSYNALITSVVYAVERGVHDHRTKERSGTMRMRHGSAGVVVAWALTLLVLSAPGQAQQTSAAHPEIEEQAMAVLKRMTEFLTQAQRFSVTVDTGFDVVQDSGQKIEFGETRQMVLRRPDRVRIEATKRDGSKSEMVFDGKDLAAFNTKENVYATVARPGTVDEAIAYFLTDLDMRLPLAELLSSQLAKTLLEQVRAAAYVEPSQIAGVPCDHLALRGDQVDLQLWVAQGSQPLPRRLVITYTREDGRPQFWAQFGEWNLAPEVPDTLFIFQRAGKRLKKHSGMLAKL